MWEYVALLLAAAYLSFFRPVYGILGGHDTNITRRPFMVSLQNNGNHFCGGSLIAKGWDDLEWVLTSAQCASKFSDLSIRAYSSYASSGGEVYKVGESFVHPDYNQRSLDSDIALLRLSEPVPNGPVWGINLPYLDDEIEEGAWLTITGWGKTSLTSTYSEVLQMNQIPALTLDQCRQCYSANSVTDNMFCAGYLEMGNRTSCDGDYGGPGIITGGWIRGIQSWGKSCGIPQNPTVFTKVINFVPWIVEITGIKVPPGKSISEDIHLD